MDRRNRIDVCRKHTFPIAVVLMVTLLASQAAGQRARVFGRAFRLDGTAWANATVTLTARPIPEYWHVGKPDTVRVQTDDRGRFQAMILGFRTYSTWAHELLAEGGYRMSEIVEDTVQGRPIKLIERREPQVPIHLRVVLSDGTPHAESLTFHMLARSPRSAFVVPLTLDQNRECDLPPMPGTYSHFEVLTADGRRLWQTFFRQTKRLYEDNGFYHGVSIDDDDKRVLVIRPPCPTEVDIRVVSATGEKPLAGAVICAGPQDSAGSMSDVHDSREFARTDADGHAKVGLFLHFDDDGKLEDPKPSLRIWAEGHAEAVYRMMERIDMVRSDPTILVKLHPTGHAVRGCLFVDADTPARDMPILVYQSGHFTTSKPWVASTNSAGEFRVPGRFDNAPYRVTAIVPKDQDGFGDEAHLACVQPGSKLGRDVDLGTLRIDMLQSIDVEVVDETGSPAPHAWVHVGETKRDAPWTYPTYRTDRRGITTLRMKSITNLAIFAADKTGFAFARIEDEHRNAKHIQLQLQRASTIEGLVTDSEGRPIEGARVVANCGYHQKLGRWHEPFFEGLCHTSPALHHRSVYTDDEGRFRLPFPELGATVNLMCWKTVDTQLLFVTNQDPTPVRLSKPTHSVRLVLAPKK
ncbi:MAG: carboxypeptidase regulatory-like domain-containing protein [Planctomycetes bacterium]|nr:carboxypeptidase regulatory-like domain-containing protein [Planctomycetota bacterium]